MLRRQKFPLRKLLPTWMVSN